MTHQLENLTLVLIINHSVLEMLVKHSAALYYHSFFAMQTAATHTRRRQKRIVNLVWTAPPVGTGCICFRLVV